MVPGCSWMTHWRIPITGAEGESRRSVCETLRPKDSDICSRSIKGLVSFVCKICYVNYSPGTLSFRGFTIYKKRGVKKWNLLKKWLR